MKHGKKTLSALLTLSVFCGLLPGCAGSGGSASSAAGAPTVRTCIGGLLHGPVQ